MRVPDTYQLVGMKTTPLPRNATATRERLVAAAVQLILRQGFPATSVEEICAEAGVTKGSFFHHFKTKEAIGLAAAQGWFDGVTAFYTEALQAADPDPLKQLDAFFDALENFTRVPDRLCSCVIGMLSQEMALVHPEFRSVAAGYFNGWTERVAELLVAAKAKYPPVTDFDPEQVAWYLNALWQGSIVVTKAVQSAAVFHANLRMARAWTLSFFSLPHPASGSPFPPSP